METCRLTKASARSTPPASIHISTAAPTPPRSEPDDLAPSPYPPHQPSIRPGFKAVRESHLPQRHQAPHQIFGDPRLPAAALDIIPAWIGAGANHFLKCAIKAKLEIR